MWIAGGHVDRARCFVVVLLLALLCTIAARAQSPEMSAAKPQQQPAPSAPTGTASEVPQADKQDQTAEPATEKPAESADDIRIGPGDLVEIRVFGVPDLTQEGRVSSGGELSVSLVGSVQIAGLTTSQAQRKIATVMQERGYLNNPQITVMVKEYATQGISVLGEVAKPGIYPLLGQHRLFDVISAAGGTTARAGRTITIAHRDDPENPVVIEMTTEPSKAAASNVDVLPGDTVLVSRAGVVYVVGDVARPSGFTMDSNERMSVLQAIALAGGTNSTAALDSSKILRRSGQGVQEIPIPLSKLLTAKMTDQTLQAEDVLFVPRSLGKSVARRSAEAILQVATGLAIYGRY